jgi:hypothetical protein
MRHTIAVQQQLCCGLSLIAQQGGVEHAQTSCCTGKMARWQGMGEDEMHSRQGLRQVLSRHHIKSKGELLANA